MHGSDEISEAPGYLTGAAGRPASGYAAAVTVAPDTLPDGPERAGPRSADRGLSRVLPSQCQGGIGPEFAAILRSEGFFRHFENRRQIAAFADLGPHLMSSNIAAVTGLEFFQPLAPVAAQRLISGYALAE
jgi:hypothetical protein